MPLHRMKCGAILVAATMLPLAPALALAQQAEQSNNNYQRYLPDIGVVMDLGLGWFWNPQDQRIHQEGHAIDSNGFALQSLELSVSGSVDPYFRYDMHFDFSALEMEDAYLATLSLPAGLQVRAGKIIAPFGRQNPRHLHSWSFVNPSLSYSRFLGEDHFMSLGAELSWIMPLPWFSELTAEILDPKSGEAGFGLDSTTFGLLNNLTSPGQMIYTAHWAHFVDLSDDTGFMFGFSGGWGPSAFEPGGRAQLYGADLYFKWRPVSSGLGRIWFATTIEYLIRNADTPYGTVWDNGGYIQFDIAPAKEWVVSLRGDYCDVISGKPFGPIVDGVPLSLADAFLGGGIAGAQVRGSAAISFEPTHFSRIRAQYDVGKQSGMETIYQAAFLQIEVALGTHGAHSY